ncbi:MAG: TonB-dependent receptor [Sulfurovaceae bacterium]|jgi:iron complex outermembrane recepter protein
MKKTLFISCICAASLVSSELDLGDIEIEGKIDNKKVKDVRGSEIKSADVAEALSKNIADLTLVRRSGIANDIILRGFKKDNLNITIDNAKIFGACPNRMDPPTSHVLSSAIESIEITEGPFNVEDFGSLGADISIKTLEPKEDFGGEILVNAGSFGYKKGSALVTGGNDKFKFLISGSIEKGEQYEDGNGDDFVGQIDKAIARGDAVGGNQYQPQYENMDAFEKKSFMGKVLWDINENHQIRFGYTNNQSDNILYPNTPMDAIYDDSEIITLGYKAKNLGAFSKVLDLEFYTSSVEHPMSNVYRRSAVMMAEMTHYLETKTSGIKLKNNFELANHMITAGIDWSNRNWDGGYYKDGTPLPAAMFHSIYDVDTENRALFIKDDIKIGEKLSFELGARYDDTSIETPRATSNDRDFDDFSGYLYASYKMDESMRFFGGIGKSVRVPDPKELYFYSKTGASVGNDTLDSVKNYEADIGLEKSFGDFTIKGKLFYSMLKDFIAYNASKPANNYENVDAKIYGIDISGSYIATETLMFNYAFAYQKGKKDSPLEGQLSKNLAEIPPMKAILGVTYMPIESLSLEADLIAAASWDNVDSENGEQDIGSYGVVNLKATKTFANNIEWSIGVDNLFDKVYQTSNTYKDLTLLTGADDSMLLNEPGRYIYTQLKYKF